MATNNCVVSMCSVLRQVASICGIVYETRIGWCGDLTPGAEISPEMYFLLHLPSSIRVSAKNRHEPSINISDMKF